MKKRPFNVSRVECSINYIPESEPLCVNGHEYYIILCLFLDRFVKSADVKTSSPLFERINSFAIPPSFHPPPHLRIEPKSVVFSLRNDHIPKFGYACFEIRFNCVLFENTRTLFSRSIVLGKFMIENYRHLDNPIRTTRIIWRITLYMHCTLLNFEFPTILQFQRCKCGRNARITYFTRYNFNNLI